MERFSSQVISDHQVISVFNRYSGFFSMFFFFVNHYIYAVKNKLSFKINSDNWLFKYKLGWEDYFENIDNGHGNNSKCIIGRFNIALSNYCILDYKNVLSDIYKYNQHTIDMINKKKHDLDLVDKEYCSIFIRRGDKLLTESNYIHAKEYLMYLIELKPLCKIIYLQTDDYNCYIELDDYIKKNKLDIKVITMCEKYCKGMTIFSDHKNSILNGNFGKDNNVEYLKTNIKHLSKFKPVDKMNNIEIYNHTLEMIIGIDIVLKSNIVVTDYSSNVARFIKLKHSNNENVYDVISKSNNLDYSKVICPGCGF